MCNLMLYLLHSHFGNNQRSLNPLPLLMLDAYHLQVLSTIIFFVGQHFKHISWISFYKCYYTSICLVWEWCAGLFESVMHHWLSHIMDVDLSCPYLWAYDGCRSILYVGRCRSFLISLDFLFSPDHLMRRSFPWVFQLLLHLQPSDLSLVPRAPHHHLTKIIWKILPQEPLQGLISPTWTHLQIVSNVRFILHKNTSTKL